jgi:hypothetical protein
MFSKSKYLQSIKIVARLQCQRLYLTWLALAAQYTLGYMEKGIILFPYIIEGTTEKLHKYQTPVL